MFEGTLWYVLATTIVVNPLPLLDKEPGDVLMSSFTSVWFTEEQCLERAQWIMDDLNSIRREGSGLYSIATCVELPAYIVQYRPGLLPGEPA